MPPTLETFKQNVDNYLAIFFDLSSSMEQGVGLDGFLGPFQLDYSLFPGTKFTD